ncbi:MAG: outer membrane protein assembly factor BamD [SAR324 cluster bacterium]|nr:outer membrane protein assembly factor BamD [SAR324 cluster bacterium]
MRRRFSAQSVLGCWLIFAIALIGCETAKPRVKIPGRLLYLEGQALADVAVYSEAVAKFQEVVDQNPGTLLGTFAYLKIAEIHAQQEDWLEAETNYRLFLTTNQLRHLTPYVLYRLITVHHENSFTGVFFPSREVDRDMEPNRQIIREYKRFFFLFPKSIFLEEIRSLYRAARDTLAEHERLVGDFYLRRGHYDAAASRYVYLLRTFPQYQDAKAVLERLIEAYRLNQQPDLAREMERLYRLRFAPPDTEGGQGAEQAADPWVAPGVFHTAALP